MSCIPNIHAIFIDHSKKKRGGELWIQGKLWFPWSRTTQQIQEKRNLHQLKQNMFCNKVDFMHADPAIHVAFMNHDIKCDESWIMKLYFLCVCVREREREREGVTSHVSIGLSLLKWHCFRVSIFIVTCHGSHKASPWTHFQTHTALYIYIYICTHHPCVLKVSHNPVMLLHTVNRILKQNKSCS